MTLRAPSNCKAISHVLSPTTIPSIDDKIKINPLNDKNMEVKLNVPVDRTIIKRSSDAKLHLKMFKAKADPFQCLSLQPDYPHIYYSLPRNNNIYE